MIQPHEPAILDLAVLGLQAAIRRAAARILEAPGDVTVADYRRVERLMRIALALAGAGSSRMPHVQVHGLPPGAEPGALPELLSVDLTDLLAARAGEHLAAAPRGEPAALRAVEHEAERLLESEDIQLG
ncbi:MAG TPA: hypothetical protein VF590_22020 [Isosphaeraceae bacterium]